MEETSERHVIGKVKTVSAYLKLIFNLEAFYNLKNYDEVSEADEVEEKNDIFNAGVVTCYRGQANSAWGLSPSILRGYEEDAEALAIRELMLEAPDEFNNDKLMFDKLVRAQHYGLPTRLLDVSLNPLVALYFACCELKNESDGKVYIISFGKNRVKFSDSDAISLVSNLARMTGEEKENLRKNRKTKVAEFRQLKEIKRLVSFVQAEKPYFTNIVSRVDLFKYYFIYPSKNNKRVIAQSGSFISSGLLTFASPGKNAGISVLEVIIPAGSKEHIVGELDKLNINSRSLFPEIEFASTYIKNKYRK